METNLIKLSKIRVNDKNPRTITEDKLRRLVESILVFPKMLTIRPIVIDDKGVALGGNMRTRALKEIKKLGREGLQPRLQQIRQFNTKPVEEQNEIIQHWDAWFRDETVPVIYADTLTEEEKREFIIKDNSSFGAWDWDVLANEWESEQLDDWGVDVWQIDETETEFDGTSDSKKSNDVTDDRVETMLNETSKQVADDLIKQFDTLQGFSFITPSTAKFDFIRFAYYNKEYPRYNSLAFHPKQFITQGDKYSTYEGLQMIASGKIKGDRLRFVCNDKFRSLISGSLAFCGSKMPLDFPADIAKELIDEFSNGGRVLDPCAGWGGRMVGFLASKASFYDGTDASPYQCEGVQHIFDTFKDVAPSEKDALITCMPFEKRELEHDAFDMAITSPPYFDREKYIGGEQSRDTNGNYDEWRDNFYHPLIAKVYNALKVGCVFCLQVGSQFYPLLEDGKKIAESVGFAVEDVRETDILNNQANTEQEKAELIIILRKIKKNAA